MSQPSTPDPKQTEDNTKTTVRVNFDLDREEHIKLKIYAAKQGKTIAEVLRTMIASLP